MNFAGDQAMFLVFAEEMTKGAVLYRDLWDVKQPGIFLFYIVAGVLFGFDETGVHLFELLYWIFFAVLLVIALRKYFTNEFLVLLLPLFTVGFYYLTVGSWHMTQVEGIVGFPLFFSIFLPVISVSNPSSFPRTCLLITAGLLSGIVVALKIAFLPILLATWMSVLYFQIRSNESGTFRRSIYDIFKAFLGLLLIVVPLILYFARHQTLGEFSYTTFDYPLRVTSAFGSNSRLPILIEGFKWFVVYFSFLLFVNALGIISVILRSRAQMRTTFRKLFIPETSFELLINNLVIWLVVGVAVIVVQSTSWWAYHFLLLSIPLGILAVFSIDRAQVLFERSARFVSGASGVLLVMICSALLLGTLNRVTSSAVIRIYDRSAPISWSVLPFLFSDPTDSYERIEKSTAYLRSPESVAGPIFVCADPLYYYLSKRSPALVTNGWSPEYFLPEKWGQLEEELLAKRPKYVIIDKGCRDLMEANSKLTIDIVDTQYRPVSIDDNSSWYVLAEPW